jgi:hypothetical protein
MADSNSQYFQEVQYKENEGYRLILGKLWISKKVKLLCEVNAIIKLLF